MTPEQLERERREESLRRCRENEKAQMARMRPWRECSADDGMRNMEPSDMAGGATDCGYPEVEGYPV